MNNIFVGNLSFTATKEDVIKLFEPLGTVADVVIMEQKKHKSRGYGFVDMPNEEEKNAAIAALEGKEFMGRILSVGPVVPKAKGAKRKKFIPAKVPKKEWNTAGPRAAIPTGKDVRPFRKDKDGPKPWVKKEEGSSKPFRRDGERDARGKSSGSKPYSKFDGSANMGEKLNKAFKPRGASSAKSWPKKDEGSRPYYGKKDDAGPSNNSSGSSKPPYKKFDSKSKPWMNKEGGSKPFGKPGGGGFKMSRKVSGKPKDKS